MFGVKIIFSLKFKAVGSNKAEAIVIQDFVVLITLSRHVHCKWSGLTDLDTLYSRQLTQKSLVVGAPVSRLLKPRGHSVEGFCCGRPDNFGLSFADARHFNWIYAGRI